MRQILMTSRNASAKAFITDAVGLAAICASVFFVLSLPGLG